MDDTDLPAWFTDKATKQRQNRRSSAQEKRVAKEVGGRQVVGSGSSWRAPGDVKSDTHLIEHKFTDAASFRLTVKDWRQARKDATVVGREPAMIIEFPEAGLRLVVTEMEA
jgi:hypothetical protein